MTHKLELSKNVIFAILTVLSLAIALQATNVQRAHADDEQHDIAIVTEPTIGDTSENADEGGQPNADAPLDADTASQPGEEPAPAPFGIRYKVVMRSGSWTDEYADYAVAGEIGAGQRVRNLRITLDSGAYSGSVMYRARLATGTWTAWKTSGKNLGGHNNIVAIQVKLTGEIAQSYDVVYRAYIDTMGWQRRMRNGESAGVEGSKLRIEAIQVALVKKTEQDGWVNSDGVWSYYKDGTPVASSWLDTDESPIDTALVGKRRYWLDANGALAVERYILPENEADAKAGYAAYATGSGYVFCGKRSSGDGVTLSDGEGRLFNGTRWLTTSAFDSKPQRYRLSSVGSYAVVQTGLFKVNGKKYYGYEDGRGYVMRSTTRWAAGKWYKAGAKGVLRNVDKKTKSHIERYVKWAVKVAKNDAHGYTQAMDGRWGPDYDCSSFVASSLLKAGFPNSGATWTGNMKKCLKSIGFKWHKNLSQLKRGDILLVHNGTRQHTEIYLGNNKLVGAHIAETGGVYGATGDQTGNEISVTKYYNAPWQGFLRYRS